MSNDQERGTKSFSAGFWLAWAYLAALIVFLFIYILPRKGVDFSDEGWVLSGSLMAAEGRHLDLVVPQAPFYAVNALLIRAGIDSYLGLRYTFYVLIVASLWIFLTGIDPTQKRSAVLPVLISFGLLTTLSSLISYSTGPIYFMLLGLGMMFRVVDTTYGRNRLFLAVGAAVALSFCAMLNLTVLPAVLLAIVLFWIAYRRQGTAFLITLGTWVSLSGISILCYLRAIGLKSFLGPPGGHGIFSSRVVPEFRFLTEWLIIWFALICAMGFVVRKFRPVDTVRAVLPLGLPVLALMCSLFALPLLDKLWGLGWARFAYAAFWPTPYFGLQWCSQLSSFTCFGIVGFWALAVLSFASLACIRWTTTCGRFLLAVSCILALIAFQMFFSLMEIPSGSVYYAGPAFAVGFWVLFRTSVDDRTPFPKVFKVAYASAITITLSFSLAYTLGYNHPSLPTPLEGPRVPIAIPRLEGIMEIATRRDALEGLWRIYHENDCQQRTLITFHCTPLLHYIFDAQPVDGLEYIYMPYIFEEGKILSALGSQRGWCVFVSRNWLPMRDWIRALPVLEYMQENSQKVLSLSAFTDMRDLYGDFVVYVGPGEQTMQKSAHQP